MMLRKGVRPVRWRKGYHVDTATPAGRTPLLNLRLGANGGRAPCGHNPNERAHRVCLEAAKVKAARRRERMP